MKEILLSMSDIILMAHSGWRFIVLLMLVVTIIKMVIGIVSKGTWSNFDEWLNRLTPIVLDIQFLLGIILWIIWLIQLGWSNMPPVARIEHPVTMIIAIAIAHVTNRRVKSAATDAAKYQTATIGYLISTVIVVLGVLRITRII